MTMKISRAWRAFLAILMVWSVSHFATAQAAGGHFRRIWESDIEGNSSRLRLLENGDVWFMNEKRGFTGLATEFVTYSRKGKLQNSWSVGTGNVSILPAEKNFYVSYINQSGQGKIFKEDGALLKKIESKKGIESIIPIDSRRFLVVSGDSFAVQFYADKVQPWLIPRKDEGATQPTAFQDGFVQVQVAKGASQVTIQKWGNNGGKQWATVVKAPDSQYPFAQSRLVKQVDAKYFNVISYADKSKQKAVDYLVVLDNKGKVVATTKLLSRSLKAGSEDTVDYEISKGKLFVLFNNKVWYTDELGMKMVTFQQEERFSNFSVEEDGALYVNSGDHRYTLTGQHVEDTDEESFMAICAQLQLPRNQIITDYVRDSVNRTMYIMLYEEQSGKSKSRLVMYTY